MWIRPRLEDIGSNGDEAVDDSFSPKSNTNSGRPVDENGFEGDESEGEAYVARYSKPNVRMSQNRQSLPDLPRRRDNVIQKPRKKLPTSKTNFSIF